MKSKLGIPSSTKTAKSSLQIARSQKIDKLRSANNIDQYRSPQKQKLASNIYKSKSKRGIKSGSTKISKINIVIEMLKQNSPSPFIHKIPKVSLNFEEEAVNFEDSYSQMLACENEAGVQGGNSIEEPLKDNSILSGSRNMLLDLLQRDDEVEEYDNSSVIIGDFDPSTQLAAGNRSILEESVILSQETLKTQNYKHMSKQQLSPTETHKKFLGEDKINGKNASQLITDDGVYTSRMWEMIKEIEKTAFDLGVKDSRNSKLKISNVLKILECIFYKEKSSKISPFNTLLSKDRFSKLLKMSKIGTLYPKDLLILKISFDSIYTLNQIQRVIKSCLVSDSVKNLCSSNEGLKKLRNFFSMRPEFSPSPVLFEP